MSIPSSRLEVATTAGSRPAFRSSSTRARCSLETEPWCARARSGGAPRTDPDCPMSSAGDALVRHRLAGGPLIGDLVEAVAQALGQPAGVGEDDRGAMGLDEVDDLLFDMRPDRRLVAAVRRRRGLGGRGSAQLSHVLDRDDHREVELLAGRRLDDLHLPLRGEIAGDLVHRADRRRQADTAGRARQQLVETLQRQGEVRSPLRPRDGVHLVEDHRLDARQRVPCGGGEHQEQRLRVW